jgi:serine protease AprX
MHSLSFVGLTASWGRRCCYLLLLVALVCANLAQPVDAARRDIRVLPQLQREAAQHPSKSFRVIVTRINRDKKADDEARKEGGKKLKDFRYVDSYVAELTGRQIMRLGQHRSVKFINYDAPMRKSTTVDTSKLVTNYPKVVNATNVWPTTTGAGVGIAVIDTGVSSLNEFKTSTGTLRITASKLFNTALERSWDGNGHGTHVAGIAAGNSWNNTGIPVISRGKYVGIAPDANIINLRVSDENGMSYISDVIDAIEWVVVNRERYNIRVMNLSLISSVAESATTSPLSAAVQHAWFSGVLVVVAAGNAGPDTMKYPPANDPFVITVGATDSMNTVSSADDTIAPWSGYGTTQDGFSKPEVVAPGRYMVAPLASSAATLALSDPTRIVDGTYMRLSGTSMAAPVVSGVAALAFEDHPEWTNDQIKWLLLNTSTRLNVAAGQGAGQVNASALVNFKGTPGTANEGLKINELLIGPDGAVNYTANSTASWSTASWSTASWSTASWSTASWSTSNTSTENDNAAAEQVVK